MPTKAPAVAVYARVSLPRERGQQDPENQIHALLQFCEQRGWHAPQQYVDYETGSGARERPEFERLLKDARAGRFSVLVFWSLDRFGRKGTYETLKDLHENFDSRGIRYISHQEQFLDTLGPARDAIIGILAWVAKMERDRISERVKAGLERVRRQGRRLGRKPRLVDPTMLRKMVQDRWSIRQMAEVFHCSMGTVRSRIKQLKPEGKEVSHAPGILS
jgi:DNA invertase Pin-like site-specific DNA recombinase